MLNQYLNTVYVKLGSLSTKIMMDGRWKVLLSKILKAAFGLNAHLTYCLSTFIKEQAPSPSCDNSTQKTAILLNTCCCCSLLPAAHVSFSSLIASTSHSPPPASGLRHTGGGHTESDPISAWQHRARAVSRVPRHVRRPHHVSRELWIPVRCGPVSWRLTTGGLLHTGACSQHRPVPVVPPLVLHNCDINVHNTSFSQYSEKAPSPYWWLVPSPCWEHLQPLYHTLVVS